MTLDEFDGGSWLAIVYLDGAGVEAELDAQRRLEDGRQQDRMSGTCGRLESMRLTPSARIELEPRSHPRTRSNMIQQQSLSLDREVRD